MKNINKKYNTDKKVYFSSRFMAFSHFSGSRVLLDPSKMLGDTILPNCLVVNGFPFCSYNLKHSIALLKWGSDDCCRNHYFQQFTQFCLMPATLLKNELLHKYFSRILLKL